MRSEPAPANISGVEPEPVLRPEDVTTIVNVLGDINVNTARIKQLLEEAIHGEEPENDT